MAVRRLARLAREDGRNDRLVAGLRDRARQARPGTMRSISAISTWICVSAAISRRERARLCDRDVEARIGERKGALADRLLGRRCGLVDCAAIGLVGAFGGERRRLARDRAPPIGQLGAAPAACRRLAIQDQRRRRVVAHERPAGAAATRLDEARVQDRCAWRSVIGATPSRAVARGARPARARPRDGLAEPADDLLDGALGLEFPARATSRAVTIFT